MYTPGKLHSDMMEHYIRCVTQITEKMEFLLCRNPLPLPIGNEIEYRLQHTVSRCDHGPLLLLDASERLMTHLRYEHERTC